MPARIIIVDRAATGRILLRSILTRAAYDVTICDNMAEAVSRLSQCPVDIVLADAAELHPLVQSRQAFGDLAVQIVALARADDGRSRIDALHAGADDVLSRDAGEALILSTLRRLLRHRNSRLHNVIGPDAVHTVGFAEAQGTFDHCGGPLQVIEDAAGPITVISKRPAALPRPIRMLLERHPGPVEVAASPATACGTAALYIVDGGGFPRNGDTCDALYATVAELEVKAKAERAATLVLVPEGAEQLGAMVLDLGAEEQVAETVLPEELSHRVRRLLRRKALDDRQRDRLQSTIAAASIDPLTGLYNLRYAEARLAILAESARKTGAPLAVLMLDIDRFKTINDTHGHPTGDVVLAEVARRLRDNLRAVDLIARVGGEEFLVAMPDTAVDQARGAAERMRRIIEREPFISRLMPDARLNVTLSIGVAVSGAATGHDQTPVTLIANLRQLADIALYGAKSAGRNTVSVAPAQIEGHA